MVSLMPLEACQGAEVGPGPGDAWPGDQPRSMTWPDAATDSGPPYATAASRRLCSAGADDTISGIYKVAFAVVPGEI